MKRLLIVISLVALSAIPTAFAAEVGTIERDTLLGVPCCVYLPSGYAQRVAKDSQKVFPVLYLQHGMFGSEDDWATQGELLKWMRALLLSKQVKEMVVIMPDNFLGSIPPEERRRLMDAPDVTPEGDTIDTSMGAAHWRKLTSEQEQAYEMSGYWEEHFREFMAQAEKHYRISSDPGQRAIAGLSMGGFHTMHIAHYLYGQFAFVGLFSPVVIPHRRNEQLTMEEDSQFHTSGFDHQLAHSSPAYNNWMAEMQRMTLAPPMYWMAIGHDDFLFLQLQDYRLWLDMNNIEYTYYESRGGHTWQNWQDYICRFMKKIFWDEHF